MAFKEISLVLSTSDQDIVVVEADRQAIARLTVANNDSSARTYTIKHYKAAGPATITVRNAFSVNPKSSVDIPPITMNEGDKIIAAADANSVIVLTGAFHDTAKAVPFAVAGIDGVDPGYPWNFRDKTDVEEPDAVGDLNFNNAVLADVTKIVLSAQSAGATNPNLSDIIESWDDNGESANRGRLLLKNRNAPAQTAEFRLTGTVTYHDATIDWYEIDVEFVGGPGLSTDAELSVQFFDAGEEGAAGVSGASAMTKVDVVDAGDGSPAPDTDYEDGDEIDGVTLEANMLVLRASASDPELNGVYVVQMSGAAPRHEDFDDFDDLPGSEFNVISGDTYANTKWRCSSQKGGTIDTDPVTIEQITSMDGTQNLADVADAPTAFNNIKQDATTSYKGVVELADSTETQAGSDATRAVTPAGLRSATRERLTANRTYYVRTDGSDSNNGLTDNSGGAFLTIQAAVNAAAQLDCAAFNCTIQVRAGTYTDGVSLRKMTGAGTFSLLGDPTTPSNVIISTNNANCIGGTDAGPWNVDGFKLQSTVGGNALHGVGSTIISFQNIDFGTVAGSHHISAEFGARIECVGPYRISGSSAYTHMSATSGYIQAGYSRTITIGASVTFSVFAYAFLGGIIHSAGNTYSLGAFTVTAQRYVATMNAAISTNGSGGNYFPGNVAGATSAGGQYT